MSTPDAFARAAAIAGRQHAAIAHDQARDAGLSDRQIFGLHNRGVWRRRTRGVYVVAGSPDTPQQRLMIAYLASRRAGGVISHLSAAAVFGLASHPPLPHVTVRPGASAAARISRVHRSVVPPVDRNFRDGLQVTTVSRTIVDCAALLDRPSLEGLVDPALCRKLATRDSVLRAARRLGAGHRGTTLACEVVEVWSPVIEPGSPAEVRALRLLGELGFTDLVCQHEVFGDDGAFVARLDLADPPNRRGFEYDGLEAHNPRRWPRDERRYDRLRAMGWDIPSLSKLDLLPGEPRLRQIAARWATSRAA